MLEAQDGNVMFDRKMLCYVRCSEEGGWLDVRCSMFGCSMFDVMFGQADVMLC